MRTIKFLGFAVALAAAAVPTLAQGGLQPGAFPGIDNLARREAQRIEHQQQMRRLAGQRAGRMDMAQGRGFAAGLRTGLRANATPEQKAFVEQFRAQRETIRAQVLEGKLTRQQARSQLQKWAAEHRPKK
ncbi:MAG: hypothetical protein C0497_15575 [Gemmatimonas sp.]|nr:hypothetical protein [Gemmatimonas sp.]